MKKQVFVMIGIIVVLSIVGLIAVNFSSSKRDERKVLQPILGEVEISDIKSIVINDDIELRLNEKVWSFMVNDSSTNTKVPKPTRQDYVQSMIEKLSDFSRGRLVASNPDDLSKYQLDEGNNSSRTLVLKDDKDEELMKIKVGIIVGALSANYAQINDNPAVYEIDEELSQFLNQGAQYWQDLRVFPNGIESDSVKSIKIVKKDRDDIELLKDKSGWVDVKNKDTKISADAISSFIDDVQRAKASNFSRPTLSEDLYNGELVITLNNDVEYKITIYFFANTYFAKTVGGYDSEIKSLQEYSIDKLFPKFDYFVDKSADTESAAESASESDEDDEKTSE